MRIAIDVNGVLRDTIGKIKQVYEKHLLNQNELVSDTKQLTFKLESDGKTTEFLEEESFEYGFTEPILSLNLREFFKFRSDQEYYEFLYEDFPMEIFGHAGSTELTSLNDFNGFYLNNRNLHEILIVSDEIGKSKPSTLFFLSKFGCLVEKIVFFSKTTEKSFWDQIDILLTANPDLLLNHPDNKIVIKFNTTYNQDINKEFSISEFKQFEEILQKITQ